MSKMSLQQTTAFVVSNRSLIEIHWENWPAGRAKKKSGQYHRNHRAGLSALATNIHFPRAKSEGFTLSHTYMLLHIRSPNLLVDTPPASATGRHAPRLIF